jgi:proton glutamate symport protein
VSSPTATAPIPNRRFRLSATHWILVGIAAGIFIGEVFPSWEPEMKILSTAFLRLIKCLIVPILFGTLVVGIAGHGSELKTVGRLAFRAILYFEIATTLALLIGLVAVNLAKPGVGLHTQAAATTEAPAAPRPAEPSLLRLIPESFFKDAAENNVMRVVVFSILFGIATAQIGGPARATMVGFCDALSAVMFRMIALVMLLAPVGVGAAIAATVAHSGFHVLLQLAKLLGTLYGALLAFAVLVLLPAALIARIPVLGFLRAVRDPALLAFSTTSSDAALPDALRRMVEFGVPRRIVSFVLPLGYSFNLDGTTLYLAVASVFVAQTAGLDLSIGQQVSILLTLMVTSKGVAAVPRASFVILQATLLDYKIPMEGLVLILTVDAFMDMARTTINLVGNCLASAVLARWEGDFHPGSPAAAE